MKWLITGGAGFIGTALSKQLLDQGGHAIRVYDNFCVGTREEITEKVGEFKETASPNWDDELTVVEGDILDCDAMQAACEGADVIVHLAANTGVYPSVLDPHSDCRTNVQGTLNALEAARHNKAKRFVFASSGAPLGVQTPPLHEEMAPHPASPYGASKLAGEAYCSAYYHCFDVETVVLRFANVYGPGSTKKASVVAKFIKEAMAGIKLEIYGDGKQTRDFIYIDDLIAAIIASGTKEAAGGETFQIATSKETTVGDLTKQLVDVLKDETGIEAEWYNGEIQQGDVARNFSDTSKAERILGWKAKVGLDKGLRETIRFFVSTS